MVKGLLLLGSVLATCGLDVGPPEDPGGEAPPTTVSFAFDVLPILEQECILCHGGAGGLDVASFAGVLAGGISGPVVVPFEPASSLLIQRLDGTFPPLMPLDAPALPEPEVERVALWIREGAADN